MENKFLAHFKKCYFHWQEQDEGKVNGWDNINWRIVIEQTIYHLGALGAFWVGVSSIAVISGFLFYILDGYILTLILHRYFSHRCFETSRKSQFVFGLLALIPLQRGPLWWASHHRHHHAHTDTIHDPHAPAKGLLHSYLGWLMQINYSATDKKYVKDWILYKELIWIDRLEWLTPFLLFLITYSYGAMLNYLFPSLGTSGWQMVVWMFFIPTLLLLHSSALGNFFLHSIGGYRRYHTQDNSRNIWYFALPSFGESFHNNHHRFNESCCQGIYWWEIDTTYYVIKLLERMGIVWNLKFFPPAIVEEGKNILPKPEAH